MLEEYRASAKLIDHITIKLNLSVLVLCHSNCTQNSHIAESTYRTILHYYMNEHPEWGKRSYKNVHWTHSTILGREYKLILPNGRFIQAIPYENNSLEHKLMGSKVVALVLPESLNILLQYLSIDEYNRLYHTLKHQNGRYIHGVS